MSCLIDTDVAIHLRDGDVTTTLRLLELSDIPRLSMVSRIELEGGAAADTPFGRTRRLHLNRLLEEVEVIGLDNEVVKVYGELVKQLGFSRRRVLDRLIAATALVHDLTVIRVNHRDFRGIPGLKLEIWPAAGQ